MPPSLIPPPSHLTLHPSSLTLHPSSLTLHPSLFIPNHSFIPIQLTLNYSCLTIHPSSLTPQSLIYNPLTHHPSFLTIYTLFLMLPCFHNIFVVFRGNICFYLREILLNLIKISFKFRFYEQKCCFTALLLDPNMAK